MRALITGIEGFAGSHLAEHLLSLGDEVAGTVLPGASTENIADFRERLRLAETDVRDSGALAGFFAEAAPEVVFHLAGVTFLPEADDDPARCWGVNFTGTLNVIEAARALGKKKTPPRLVFAASMKVYAPKRSGACIETDAVGPDSIYGASKAAAEYATLAAFRSQGVPAVVLRLFNHIGPRQSESFAAAGFAAQVAKIERGEAEPVLRVGNLEAERDFADVRDVARAYRLAALKGKPGEIYNIASGKAVRVGEIVEGLGKLARKKFRVETEAGRVRAEAPGAAGAVTGDSSKFRKATGWEPEIPLERTLADLLEYHRARSAP